MRVYFDFRCLQDPCYAFRGVGFHSASLVRNARAHLPASAQTVGILDEALGELPAAYRELVDTCRHGAYPSAGRDHDLFVQLSPMTHDPLPVAPLLGRSRVLACAVVYDFIPLSEQRYLPDAGLRRGYLSRLAWLKHYQTFSPISRSTARGLGALLGVPPQSVEVTGASLRTVFAQFTPAAAAGRGPRCRFFPRHYFLIVGGPDPRKNVEAALLAHCRLLGRRHCGVGMVVVGNYDGACRDRLARLFVEHGGCAAQLEFLHDLTDDDLAVLYHQALATVCPSRAEGFSLPVVEAMACGCPVLVSDIDAHRELVEQPAARFAPEDHLRLSELLEDLLRDPGRRQQLQEAQGQVPARFDEHKVAARFWAHALRAHRARRGSRPRAASRPRLAFVTPFPPDQSGVAEYTAHSLRSVARHAMIDVFTDARPAEEHPYVRRFSPISQLPYVVDEYDQVIAVVGNSHFHAKIVEYLTRYGGACVAHDNRLADLCWLRGPQRFLAFAARAVGRSVSLEEAHSWRADPSTLPGIFFDEVVAAADPLIVHSRGIQAHVRRQYGVEPRYLPFCCYRHFAADELTAESRRRARSRLGLPPGRFAIVTFGMVHPVKGVSECVWAVENLLDWGVPADLYFVGGSGPFGESLAKLATRLGIEQHVHLSDEWVSAHAYRDYLIAADCAIQLRTHCFGGLSGAVVDCISAGLPTVANQDLAEAMEGPEYVLRVPDHFTPPLIAEQLADAYEAGLHRNRLSPARDDYVREHSFDTYAAQLLHTLGLN
jgi:glycosyltransferase involved in cell wall biosynthesis